MSTLKAWMLELEADVEASEAAWGEEFLPMLYLFRKENGELVGDTAIGLASDTPMRLADKIHNIAGRGIVKPHHCAAILVSEGWGFNFDALPEGMDYQYGDACRIPEIRTQEQRSVIGVATGEERVIMRQRGSEPEEPKSIQAEVIPVLKALLRSRFSWN